MDVPPSGHQKQKPSRLAAGSRVLVLALGVRVRVHFADLIGLWSLLALDNVKLNIIAFLQGFVAIRCDSTVVDKNIRTIVAANETEAFSVVKPLHLTFQHFSFLRALVRKKPVLYRTLSILNSGRKSRSSGARTAAAAEVGRDRGTWLSDFIFALLSPCCQVSKHGQEALRKRS